jgi:hypothetical protein
VKQAVVSEAMAETLEQYRGKWVAVLNDELVGVGESASEATDAALKNGKTDPVVFRVPKQRISFLRVR